MRRFLVPLWLAVSVAVKGQGTILFHADISGDQMIVPNSTSIRAAADFSLDSDGGLFGSIEFQDPNQDVNAVVIYYPASRTEMGARMYLFTQEPAPMNGYFLGRQLTSFERDSLFAGEWYVVVEGQDPRNSMRGPLLQVPEPTSMALGAVVLVVLGFRKIWRGDVGNV